MDGRARPLIVKFVQALKALLDGDHALLPKRKPDNDNSVPS